MKPLPAPVFSDANICRTEWSHLYFLKRKDKDLKTLTFGLGR